MRAQKIKLRRKLKKYIGKFMQFNEMVDELLKESEFVKWLLENKFGYSIHFKEHKEEFRYPPKDVVKAFVLTYRFFIQDNERISLRNIKKLYDELPIKSTKKRQFYKIRDQINKFLDSEPIFRVSGFNMSSNRKIQNVIIYGRLAHQNEKLSKIFKEWESSPWWEMIFIHFCAILFYIFEGLVIIKKINQEVIKEIEHIIRTLK
jgi:hypothetical protein